MATAKLLLLPGDGIGPEVMAEVKRVIAWMNDRGPNRFDTEEGLVGGSCYDAHGVAITDDTMAKAQAADAVIFGAVGGPKWDKVPYDARPEAGLLRLRKDLGLFANIRPAICYPALAELQPQARGGGRARHHHPARAHRRRLFRRAQTITDLGNGQKRAVDTGLRHLRDQTHLPGGFELARKRRNKSRHGKAQRVKSGVLWNEVVTQVHARVQGRRARASARDAGGMQLVRWPNGSAYRHRQPVRRHALRRRRHAHRLARHAAVGLAWRGRSQNQEAQALYEPVHGRHPTSPARAPPTRSP